MKIRIAVLADLHFDDVSPAAERRAQIADVLLARAVHRLNRAIKPDVTVVLGDLVDRCDGPDAARFNAKLRKALDVVRSPLIVLPGNHDGDAETFYTHFERPAEFTDIRGCRFACFIDPEEPNYNARRTPEGIRRMAD